MSFSWGPLLIAAVVSMAVAVTVVVLVGFATVAWSARSQDAGARPGRLTVSSRASTAVAAVCTAAVLAILVYGIVLVIG